MKIKNKEILLKYSHCSFNVGLNFSVVTTPKGKIRTLSITDYESVMTDREPNSTYSVPVNDADIFSNNKKALKEFCKFVLKELK